MASNWLRNAYRFNSTKTIRDGPLIFREWCPWRDLADVWGTTVPSNFDETVVCPLLPLGGWRMGRVGLRGGRLLSTDEHEASAETRKPNLILIRLFCQFLNKERVHEVIHTF